ncbi:suppressor of cytokine signaling 2 isoform X5 [Phyllobates terribilis]|uniref:suppressor of cytokine signaling 2 isoform X5 n=1 Tax=Phyllobates terribilis TaxID=111132 RepID=UPI003CCB03B1
MTLRSPDTADSTGTIDSGAGHRGTPPGDTQGSADKDERVAMSLGELRRSGWYWGHMTVNEAKEKLQDASEGTFLVRDSSHTDYLLTISVKTSAGPTNLRIEYREGKFSNCNFLHQQVAGLYPFAEWLTSMFVLDNVL